MRYIDVCSGISAPTAAWKPLGWQAVCFSEIEKAPSAVLAHHYPTVPDLGNMLDFHRWPDYADVDLLVGGTPCQSFSIAGLRRGLADPRGNLMLTYLAIADRYRPRWVLVLLSRRSRARWAFRSGAWPGFVSTMECIHKWAAARSQDARASRKQPNDHPRR